MAKYVLKCTYQQEDDGKLVDVFFKSVGIRDPKTILPGEDDIDIIGTPYADDRAVYDTRKEAEDMLKTLIDQFNVEPTEFIIKEVR